MDVVSWQSIITINAYKLYALLIQLFPYPNSSKQWPRCLELNLIKDFYQYFFEEHNISKSTLTTFWIGIVTKRSHYCVFIAWSSPTEEMRNLCKNFSLQSLIHLFLKRFFALFLQEYRRLMTLVFQSEPSDELFIEGSFVCKVL